MATRHMPQHCEGIDTVLTPTSERKPQKARACLHSSHILAYYTMLVLTFFFLFLFSPEMRYEQAH